jgi:hypothetical protein
MRVVSIVNDEPALGLADGAEARGRTTAVVTLGGGGDSTLGVTEAGGAGGGGGSSTSGVGASEGGDGGRGTSLCDAR